MKRLFQFVFLLFFFQMAEAQPPKPNNAETQQMVADLKKDIAQLEAELKTADAEEAETIKKQLDAYRGMLAILDPKGAKGPGKTVPPKAAFVEQFSPVVPVVLRQPVTAPAAGQDKDLYFWYHGKKVNDSTLITRRGTLVQYSKKRAQLIVEPDKKKDTSFGGLVRELTKSRERKEAMITTVSNMKNGFAQYPQVVGAVAAYDDITIRYAEAVKNTYSFKDISPSTTFIANPEDIGIARSGPSIRSDEYDAEDLAAWMAGILKKAKQQFKNLPPVSSFPAPPARDLGLCARCDTNVQNRLRKMDEDWQEAYQGKENEIVVEITSAMRYIQLLGGEGELVEKADGEMMDIWKDIINRMDEKDKILVDRVGNDLQYMNAVAPVVLGHERQKQLLGVGETETQSGAMTYMSHLWEIYQKFYNEQAGYKNHDFILDLPFHLGIERQKQLLGAENTGVLDVFKRYTNYNRFSLTMDVDFVIQDKSDDYSQKFTGTMAMKEKLYVMLIRDSCRFKMLTYSQDLSDTKPEDVLLEFSVQGGQRTYIDENDKKKTVGYSGPPSWFVRFPDTRFHFCNDGIPDTMFLSNFFADKSLSMSPNMDAEKNKYVMFMGIMANVMWMAEDDFDGQETVDIGTKMLTAITSMFTKTDPGDALARMRMQYEGWTDLMNRKNELASSISSKKATVLFQVANKSTVVTDTNQDFKRNTDIWSIKSGLTHLRIVHEPVGSQ